MSDWESLGSVDPARLADARLQLHWAAQAASAPGRQVLDHRPDYGEQSFCWLDGPAALAQGTARHPGRRPFRAALRPSPPAILLLDGDRDALRELPLDGRTLDEVYTWLTAEVEALLGRPLAQPLERPGSDMPSHPAGNGRPFDTADTAAFAETGTWFAGAHHLLSALAAHERASEVRCWPHHFDLATLISLDGPEKHPESARSIGAGLSPGDAGLSAPYFYVTPWPYPQGKELPPLAGGGIWNTEGWVGAVLDADRILEAAPAEREQRIQSFLDSAVAACHGLLEA